MTAPRTMITTARRTGLNTLHAHFTGRAGMDRAYRARYVFAPYYILLNELRQGFVTAAEDGTAVVIHDGRPEAAAAVIHGWVACWKRIEARRTDLQAEITRIEALGRVNLSRIPALYRQMAFQLENALKTDVATAREVLRPLIEGARMVEEGGQVWVESETGRAAIAVGLSLGMVAGARFTTKRRTLVS